MLQRLRGRTTPLEWFIVALSIAFLFYAWSFYAWYTISKHRTEDLARDTYIQCVTNAEGRAANHEVLLGIISIAVDGNMNDPRAKAITAYLDEKLPPRDCTDLKP